jgi:NADH-quinone oxidoreductase subunit J
MTFIFLILFSLISMIFSGFVIFSKNPVKSAFSLIVVFLGFAGIYALQGAHLLAALQILVYAGAILVLFIFVIMLINSEPDIAVDFKKIVSGVLSVGLFYCVLFFAYYHSQFFQKPPVLTEAMIEKMGGNTLVLSMLLFSDYIFPFELISVLLLSAIVGTVVVAKRKKKKVSG